MVNQEKVKLMSKLASYEKSGRDDLTVLEYFRADYVSYSSFLMMLGVSVSLLFFFLADFGGKFFDNIQTFIEFDFIGQGIDYLIIWLVFMVIYGVIASVIYRKRYNDSRRRIDIYQKMLKDLKRMQ